MGEFCVFQKHVGVVSSDLIIDLEKIGAKVCGDSGAIHTHVWVPDERYNDVVELMEVHGFYLSKPYAHHHRH